MTTRGKRDDADGVLADVAAALIDEWGTVAHWSRAAAQLLGRSSAAVCGHPVAQLFADSAVPDGLLAPVPRTAGWPALMRHESGHSVAVHCRVLPLESAALRLLLAVPADRAEESEQGAALLRALLAQDRIGLVLRDADLTVLRTNLPSVEVPTPPLGTRLADVMEPTDADRAEARLRTVLETGEPRVADEQHVRTVGHPVRERSLSVTAVRTTDRDGRPSGVAVLLTDATAQWLAARRLRLRHRAAVCIGRSLDVRDTAEDIAEVLVPGLADVAAVDLAEAVLVGDEPPKARGGGDLHLRRMALQTTDGSSLGLVRPGAVIPPFPDQPQLLLLQEGRTVVMDRATVERGVEGVPLMSRDLIPEDGRSLVIAPMTARGLVLGFITAWRTDREEPFDQQDADLLTEIAAHSSLSVDNARRYTREHRAAVTLQRRLLPAASTCGPALETVGRYLPAAGGAEIGGDWFDAIPLPSLRVAMVVGDVIGHGLHAAATMGRLRTAVQTLADLELPPDELLTRLDELVARLAAEAAPADRDAVGATCLVALYDPVAEQCTVASAGHPPPIMAGADGVARPLPVQPGPPLGVGGLPFEPATVRMTADDWLALYTDGLLTRPADDVEAAVLRLADRITALRRSGSTLEAAGRALTEQTGLPAPDDTALLLARVRPLPRDAIGQWEFPADPETVADARAAASGRLALWGLTDLDFTVELIVSELVTNAIRYAGGPIGLRLIRGDVLVCEVSDPSNTQPRLRRASLADEGGRGLFLVAQLSTRWGSRYGRSGKTIWAELALPE
ncbi:SpoIIE family protein phosphatase [Streptomyces sp. BBFR109]|uniref:SpoIIE family protein phosphatase n=1 Tax=Streptomyces sp. BBFR109 TaxID=3448172 RepID=UPI003F75BC5B